MPKKLFVESIPLVEDRISGVGHSIADLVGAIIASPDTRRPSVRLVVPIGRSSQLKRWPRFAAAKTKVIPVKLRIINGLMKYHLLPPMDLFLGRGVYLFGNFRNWPLTRHSKSLTYIHDICFALYPEFVQPMNQQMLIKNAPHFIARTTKVVTVSEASKHEICDYYSLPEERVIVIHNGVNTELYKPYSADEITKVQHDLAISKDYFIVVGNIEPRKNIASMVRALIALPEATRHQYGLVMVGAGSWLSEDIDRAIAEAKEAGVTIYRPDRYLGDDEVAVLTAGAKALLQTSYHEGFGMSPLQALAAGVPTVVSNIPAHKEVLGEAALYCDPYSIPSITAAIQRLLSQSVDETSRLRKQGDKIVARFSWQRSAEQFMAAYKELTKQ